MANILITGGSRGIGAEAVRQFTAAGHKVVFTYLKSEIDADRLRQETGAVPVRCDVKHHDSVKIAVDKAVSVMGHRHKQMGRGHKHRSQLRVLLHQIRAAGDDKPQERMHNHCGLYVGRSRSFL